MYAVIASPALLIPFALLTGAVAVLSLRRDKALLGADGFLKATAGWFVLPTVGFIQFGKFSEIKIGYAAWICLGTVWLALACTGGRLALMSDMLIDEDVAGPEYPAIRRRIRIAQFTFLGVVFAVGFVIYILVMTNE